MDGETRLDFLEGRVEEQSRNWERLFADVGRVDQRIDSVSVRIDTVSDALSARIDVLAARLDRLDEKLDRKFDTLQVELSKQFRWTIGVTVTLTIGVITAVLTR